jgi:Tfp pilus assembly protein PilV
MTRTKRALRALRADQGWTLVELLWVMVLGLIVLGLGLAMLNFALRTESTLSDRSAATSQGRAMMERLTRELRQSSDVSVATPTRIVFVTWVKSATCGGVSSGTSIECQVDYSCTSGRCTRVERNVDGTGGGATFELVEGLLTSNVFSYVPSAASPQYVNVTLSFPATNEAGETEDAVTLEDGVNLRNSEL